MKNQDSSHKPEWRWNGRSLANYKSMQSGVAKSKGVEKELTNAKSLTAARKIVYGLKRRQTK